MTLVIGILPEIIQLQVVLLLQIGPFCTITKEKKKEPIKSFT
jgi:hypothetical protein